MQRVFFSWVVGVAGGLHSPGDRGLQQEAGEPHAVTFTGHGDMLLLDKQGHQSGKGPCAGARSSSRHQRLPALLHLP